MQHLIMCYRCANLCSMKQVDPRCITKETYEARIRQLVEERGDLACRDEALAREQGWLEQGLAIFHGGEPSSVVREPTLREAIVMAFKASSRQKAWAPSEVVEALQRRGRLPSARSAPQMVRNRMRSMVEKGELLRDDDGTYRLAPDIRNTGLLRVETE
jgi:hypothetical protein